MNIIACDNCDKKGTWKDPVQFPIALDFGTKIDGYGAVTLSVDVSSSGFKHFCCEVCFWEWADKNKPKAEQPPSVNTVVKP